MIKYGHFFDQFKLSKSNQLTFIYLDYMFLWICWPCRDGLVVNVSSSHAVGHGFASPWVHSKDHHRNCTNCLPAWHTDITRVGVWQCSPDSVWTCLLHLHSPRLLCVRSLGSPCYDYVYFNSASSGIQWVVSLLQWLTKLSVSMCLITQQWTTKPASSITEDVLKADLW